MVLFLDIAGPFGGAVGPIRFNHCEEEDFWTRVAQYQLDLQDMEEARWDVMSIMIWELWDVSKSLLVNSRSELSRLVFHLFHLFGVCMMINVIRNDG